MPVTFDRLQLGEPYNRKYLAQLWGYQDWHALSRGAITPKNTNIIILFITKDKQDSLPQYQNYFEDNLLFIEGETNHSHDSRIINSQSNNDNIYLFYREKHHMDFIFYGEITLKKYEIRIDEPSKFTFNTNRFDAIANSNSISEQITHGNYDESFIPDEEGKRYIQQHISYERSSRNRAEAIRLHGTVCKVCGFDFNKAYGKELARDYIEIHHIKSVSQHTGLVNPSTDLMPLCSNCHSMIHRSRTNPLQPEELRHIINKART